MSPRPEDSPAPDDSSGPEDSPAPDNSPDPERPSAPEGSSRPEGEKPPAGDRPPRPHRAAGRPARGHRSRSGTARDGLRRRAARLVGAGPLTLLLLAASFALACYAGVRLLEDDWWGVLLWFAGAALLHDLVLLPLYALADRALRSLFRGRRRGRVNHLRVPAALSLLLLLVWLPLITRRRPAKYAGATGLSPEVFLPRWLAVTAALFALSAAWALLREARARHRSRTPAK
ncbi:hypothetical protein [Streptomyces physcomitrii]|uniref:hypothetical protein n=1 Tax=Streptomyces physcomitrii TaxID=2724184 RepID=UPI0035E42E63